MKIIKKEHVFNIYANSTLIYANNTRYYANIESLSVVNGVKLFPRKNRNDLIITITNELTGDVITSDALMFNKKTHYELQFVIATQLDELQRFYVELNDANGDVIYKGQLLVTNQDTQKMNYE